MEFCKKIYTDKERVLGEAFLAAKRAVISQNSTNDNLYGPAVLWTLFGDPALNIKYPGGLTDIVTTQSEHFNKRIQFSNRDHYIRMPADGVVSVFSANGSAIVKKMQVYEGSQVKLATGTYFISFKDIANKECMQKIVVSK
jgi:hypothetical protein